MHFLQRSDYEELHVLAGLENAPPELREHVAKTAYPISTQAAVSELRCRFIDADVSGLHYLRDRGTCRPKKEGRDVQWSREDIDRAAEALASQGRYTSGGHVCAYFDLDPADLQRQRSEEATSGLHGDNAILILPGAPGLGVPATIRSRPMTADERRDWEVRVEAAK